MILKIIFVINNIKVMSFKEVVKIGLKLIGGIIAGAAVFFGIGKLFKEKKEEGNDEEVKEDRDKQPAETKEEGVNINKENRLVEGFKSFQNVFGKVFILLQSLTVLIENTFRVFSKDNTIYQQSSMYQYNPGWTYSQPVNVGVNGDYWSRRISPFITEVGPCNPNPGDFYNEKRYPV